MATPGKRIDDHTRQSVKKRLSNGDSIYKTARELYLSEPTVRKIKKEMLTSLGNGNT